MTGARTWALGLALSVAACTGNISGGGAPGTTPDGVNTGTAGAGVANPGGAPPLGNLPVTGPIVSAPSASTRFPRLNHAQWENTVRDLFKLSAPLGLSSTFVAEPLRSAFDTNAAILSVDNNLWSDYEGAAEKVANKVARDPKLLGALTAGAPADAAGKARAFVQGVGLRAFRRPLTDAEVTRYQGLFDKGVTAFASGDAFADGAELVLTALLQSPHFLYRVERSTAQVNGRVALDDFEIATRLSYGLTNTMPDDALFAAAQAGQLRTRDGVLAQARRMLELPAARQAVSDFHAQLLRLGEYDALKKDSPLFPVGVGADLKSETLGFVQDVVFGRSLGVTELFTAPYTFANSRVAKLYGVAVPTPKAGAPDPFVRVDLDPTQRAGLLTQIGFLSVNAEGPTPNIIMRGVHIARDVLCASLPPPPAAVPPLPALTPDSTNRQRVAELTKNAPCNACHTAIINPLGYAFENLDGLGQYRTQDNGQTIDASGTAVLDGQTVAFTGAVAFAKAAAASRQVHDCYAGHLVEYIYGREVDTSVPADGELVVQAGARSKGAMGVKELIVNLVATDAFTTRLP